MSYAVFSCDLDGVADHLRGYGFDDAAADDAVYDKALPRMIDLLQQIGAPAVAFVIARDAARRRDSLRRAAAAGIEIASHSFTHPQPFRCLDDRRLRQEIDKSRVVLSEASQTEVVGFRAPGWDVDQRVLDHLGTCGYRYDASSFPSPVLILARAATCWRGGPTESAMAMTSLSSLVQAAEPHRRPCNGGSTLMEFPIAVTRMLRLPVYQTLSHLAPAAVFRRALRSLLRTRRPISYAFHAVDLLDVEIDGLDPRLRRHPGMQTPLPEKLARLRETLHGIASNRPVLTYRQALDLEAAA